MTVVKFYDDIADEQLKFAVIIAKTSGKYVFCKHKDRDTWEILVATEKREKTSLIQQNGNYMKKPCFGIPYAADMCIFGYSSE